MQVDNEISWQESNDKPRQCTEKQRHYSANKDLYSQEDLYGLPIVGSHWRRQWQPSPVLLPRKSHGQRSLVGCSPWGCWESDMTERLHFHFSLSSIGEGNGNPLQYSCLENPRDRGDWWAAVHGVAQSQTQLKQLTYQNNNNNKNLKILWRHKRP